MDESRGAFVFFMDSDDYMGRETLGRLYSFATHHRSEIVVPKLVGVGGRGTSDRPWATTTADADLERVFLTLSPQKLFKRSFLVEQGLRFPEGKVRLEDGIFLARAYLTASRVSTVGDYDYYFLRARGAGGNISATRLDPQGYLGSVATIMRTVRELCREEGVADSIVLDLYRRKALKVFAADRFLKYAPETRRAWTDAVQQLARQHVPIELESRLAEPFRTRSKLARAGDVQGQVAFALYRPLRQRAGDRLRRSGLATLLPARAQRRLGRLFW